MVADKRKQLIKLVNPAFEAGTDVLDPPMPLFSCVLFIVGYNDPDKKRFDSPSRHTLFP